MRSRPVEHPELLDFRATILLCVASVVLSVREFTGADLSALHITYETWPQEPWRLLTACLLHGGWLHLAFNIYWTYRFGQILEPVLGLVAMVGVFVLLGFTSSAAQWALDGGGVGLSGIGYGLFGILWALDRYHPSFHGVIRRDIINLFVVWFFLCIAATQLGVMNIANIAHGTGAVVGGLLGTALSPKGMKRGGTWALLGTLTLAIVLGSTVGRPYVNRSLERRIELHKAALLAFDEADPSRAADLLQQAISIEDEDYVAWHNLGLAYTRLGKEVEAVEAFERAEVLERQLGADEKKPGGKGGVLEGLLEGGGTNADRDQ